MSVFGFRRAPGMRWTPPLPHVSVEPDTPAQTVHMLLLHSAEAPCDLALPETFALRLEARGALTPRSPARCPLEATALRQWCVRLQREACPLEAMETPAFLQRR